MKKGGEIEQTMLVLFEAHKCKRHCIFSCVTILVGIRSVVQYICKGPHSTSALCYCALDEKCSVPRRMTLT